MKQRNGEQKLKIDQQSQQILALIAKEDSNTRQITVLQNANKELQDQCTATNNKLLITTSSLRHLQGQTESRVQWFSRKTEEAGYEARQLQQQLETLQAEHTSYKEEAEAKQHHSEDLIQQLKMQASQSEEKYKAQIAQLNSQQSRNMKEYTATLERTQQELSEQKAEYQKLLQKN